MVPESESMDAGKWCSPLLRKAGELREYLSVKIQLLEISGTAPGFSGTGRFQSRTGKGYMEAGKAGYPGPGKSGKKI